MATTRKTKQAEILREYGPFPGVDQVHGVTFDGARVWFARGEGIVAFDPGSGAQVRELAVAADAGTAFDGEYLWQLADDRIQKVDPRSGQVVATIPAPAQGRCSGLTWAEGTLWVGEYRARSISVDAEGSLGLENDGDSAGTTPARLCVLPGSVRFLVKASQGR